MGVPVVGMVFVESSWVRQTGMSTLFESKGPSGDVRIIFVTSCNISDSTFAGVHSKAGNHCDNGLGES
jgi:hypothetical protein